MDQHRNAKGDVRPWPFTSTFSPANRNGTLYAGMTDDLARRVNEHREKVRPGFSRQYAVTRLVWCESHATREAAFIRERQIKKWRRAWKLRIIEESNPGWLDLYETLHL